MIFRLHGIPVGVYPVCLVGTGGGRGLIEIAKYLDLRFDFLEVNVRLSFVFCRFFVNQRRHRTLLSSRNRRAGTPSEERAINPEIAGLSGVQSAADGVPRSPSVAMQCPALAVGVLTVFEGVRGSFPEL